MLQTQLGEKVEKWSAKAKADFKADLNKLTKVRLDVLRLVVDKIAKTYPACNSIELAALEAEQSAMSDAQALSAVVSCITYIFDNIDDESPQAVAADLTSLGLISKEEATILTDLFVSSQPYRGTAKVAAEYLRVGSTLFVGLRGTVDLRLRFHKTLDGLRTAQSPTELVGAQQVIMAELTMSGPEGRERVVSFLMDENDLTYMKRFVRNMEREMELSKDLLKSVGNKGNG
jgi:hypothetical protein